MFNEQEMELIMNYLINNLDATNTGLLLMFLTGIRVGELAALKHDDFNGFLFKIRRTEVRIKDENGKNQYLIREYPKTPSGVREEIIPKDFWWLCDKIENLNKDFEFVFMSEYGGIHRMTTNSFRRRLGRICEKLGIYKKSPHKIRKTYITILLDNNVDNNMVTNLAGHADINCSEKHYHRNRKNIDKKVEILSNIPEFQYKKGAIPTE